MEITTNTTKGGTVILRTTERGEIEAVFNHPATGAKIIISRPVWGASGEQAGVVGEFKSSATKRQRVCLVVPRDDWDSILRARDEEKAARLASERETRGAVRAMVFPELGEAGFAWVALSGKPAVAKMDGSGMYQYFDIIGDVEPVQENSSLSSYQWSKDRKNDGGTDGYRPTVVYLVSFADEAGITGTAQAKANAKISAETARIEAEERKVVGAKAEAAATGKPVKIRSYSCGCNDPREECNLDIVTVWAQPDGSVRETRTHTW